MEALWKSGSKKQVKREAVSTSVEEREQVPVRVVEDLLRLEDLVVSSKDDRSGPVGRWFHLPR